MQKIYNPPTESKSPIETWLDHHLIGVVLFVDSIWLFVRYLPKGLRTAIAATSGSLWVEPCKDRQGQQVGWRIGVHQPSLAALAYCDQLQIQHRAALYGVDLAIDFLTRTAKHAKWFEHWLVTHMVMPWRRRGPMHDDAYTTSWVKQSSRTWHSRRDLCVYADRPSKVDGQPCAHLELRLQSGQACRSHGIHRARDLRRLDPLQTFDHCTRISYAGEAYAQKYIRKSCAKLRGSKATHLVEERLLAEAHLETATMLQRLGHDRAQWVKDHYPKRIKTTLSVSSVLPIPKRLTWLGKTHLPMSRPNIRPLFSKIPNEINTPFSSFYHHHSSKQTDKIDHESAPPNV